MTYSTAFVPSARALTTTAHSGAITVIPSHITAVPSSLPETSFTSSFTSSSATDVTSFEPILPSTPALVGMTSVIVLCVVAAVVWSQQVVPVSRTKLALSKRKGPVKDYLDDLEEKGDEKPLETWLFSDWLASRNNSTRKEPALPVLKQAKWNSGDNPVLVTAAMLMVGILVASITERIVV